MKPFANKIALGLLVACLSALAGFGLFQAMHGSPDGSIGIRTPADTSAEGQSLAAVRLGKEGVLRLSDYQGQVVLLNFWATWCPPCRKEIPDLYALDQKYRADGFRVIGVAVDKQEAAEKFLQSLGVNYPNVADRRESLALMGRLGNRSGGLPFSVLIGRDGGVILTRLGTVTPEMGEEWLKQAL